MDQVWQNHLTNLLCQKVLQVVEQFYLITVGLFNRCWRSLPTKHISSLGFQQGLDLCSFVVVRNWLGDMFVNLACTSPFDFLCGFPRPTF